jgi:hypothetical protein
VSTNDIDTLLHETLSRVPVTPDGLERTLRRAERQRRRGSRLRTAVASLALAAIATATAVVGLPGRTPDAAATSVAMPGQIIDAVGTSGGMWALTCTARCDDPAASAGRLVMVDAATGQIERSIAVESPQAVSAAGDSVWTVDFWHGTVTRYSARTGDRVATVSLTLPEPVVQDDTRFLPAEISASEDDVWVTTGRGYVARIDATKNRVTAMIKGATGPVASAGGAVWVGQDLELGRIDPVTQTMSRTTIDGPGDRRLSIGSLSLVDGRLWVGGEWARPSRDAVGNEDWTVTDEAVLVEIDPTTGKVQSETALPPGTTVRGEDRDSLWLGQPRAGRVLQFSAPEGRIVASADVRATGAIVPAGDQRVWVAHSSREFRLVHLVPR